MKSTKLMRVCVVLALAVFAVATANDADARLFGGRHGCCKSSCGGGFLAGLRDRGRCGKAESSCCDAEPTCCDSAPAVEDCGCAEAAPVVMEATPVVMEATPVVMEAAPVMVEAAPVVEDCGCAEAAPAVQDCGCAEAAPCCEEASSCRRGCGGHLKGLFSRFRNRGGCCNSGCESSCGGGDSGCGC